MTSNLKPNRNSKSGVLRYIVILLVVYSRGVLITWWILQRSRRIGSRLGSKVPVSNIKPAAIYRRHNALGRHSALRKVEHSFGTMVGRVSTGFLCKTTLIQHIKPCRMDSKFTHYIFSDGLVNQDNFRRWWSGVCATLFRIGAGRRQKRLLWLLCLS